MHCILTASGVLNKAMTLWHCCSLQQFAAFLHGEWPKLSRQHTRTVADQPQRHTLLPVPNIFVVPGERFRESYYWDR